jgi:hypothetical protein
MPLLWLRHDEEGEWISTSSILQMFTLLQKGRLTYEDKLEREGLGVG